MKEPRQPDSIDVSRPEFEAVLKLANADDSAALAQLREVLDHNSTIWKSLGDMGRHAQRVLTNTIAGRNKLLYESLNRQADEMFQELAPPACTLLEKMAARRVVVSWLNLQRAEVLAATTEAPRVGMSRILSNSVESARRGHDGAVRQLLLLRQLQVNEKVSEKVPQSDCRAGRSHVPSRETSNQPCAPNGKASGGKRAVGNGRNRQPANRIQDLVNQD